MKSKWQTLSSTVEYTNPFMRIIKHDVVRPNGFRGPYYVLERTPFSIVIPLTEKQTVYLVQQYRYPIAQNLWEFPMGAVEGKQGQATAQQELKEETGFVASRWDLIGKFAVAPGHNNQIAQVFLAQELKQESAQPEAGEILTIKEFSLREVGEMITKGELIDGPTICAFHLLKVYLEKTQNFKTKTQIEL